MLRLGIHYENRLGRNDGNPLYVLAALKRRQEKNELEVDHIIPDPSAQLHLLGKYDAHIWVDWGEDGLTGLLPYKPVFPPGKPLIYWASDTHLGYDYRLECARESDIVFCAQKRAVEEFAEAGVRAEWLPHAVEPLSYCDSDSIEFSKGNFTPVGVARPYNFLTKKYDFGFVGHINSGNRVEALNRLFSEFPNFFFGQRLFNEAAQIYAQSKVSFNISMRDDVNMRCFEICGAKGFLLTNWLPTIEELGFEDGKTCALYKTLDEAVEKAKYYVEHEEERDQIAQAGYDLAMANHTIDHRVNQMLESLNSKICVAA